MWSPSLSKDPVITKMRDQMYLKHLRQVEGIANRLPNEPISFIRQYRSISEMHKRNKEFTRGWVQEEQQRELEDRNAKIRSKIQGMRGESKLKELCESTNPQCSAQLLDSSLTKRVDLHESMSPRSPKSPKPTLHYRYRVKVQEQIDRQNKKLIKSILSQKSAFLPRLYRVKSMVARKRDEEKMVAGVKQ